MDDADAVSAGSRGGGGCAVHTALAECATVAGCHV